MSAQAPPPVVSLSETSSTELGEPRPIRLAVAVLLLWPYRNRFHDQIALDLGGDPNVVSIFVSDSPTAPQDGATAVGLDHVRVEHVPAWRGRAGWLARDWPNPALWRALSAFRPTHVWIHEFTPYVLLALLWAKLHRVPCYVSTEIGDRFPGRYSHPKKKYQNLIKRLADGVVAHTQAAYETATRLGKRAVLVPHAVDTDLYRPSSPNHDPVAPVRFLQVGSFNERKGIDLLLAAFNRCVAASTSKVELVLLGAGDEDWVQTLIRSASLEGSVFIHPFASGKELIEQYQQADVFVHATREDTYAVVVHEAASCGLPLVVSKYAGASETLVVDGTNGFVVDPYDAETFSATLLRIASDSALRGRFGQRSRALAEEFASQANATKFVNWLRERK